MAPHAGKDFLLKSGDGAGTEVFTTMGGLRSTSISINGEAVDGTHVGSNGWKQLIAGAGISSVSVSGSGVFTNDANEKLAITRCMAKTLNNYKVIDDAGNEFAGSFQITSMELAGEYNGEQTYSMSLESSGPVVFTPGV